MRLSQRSDKPGRFKRWRYAPDCCRSDDTLTSGLANAKRSGAEGNRIGIGRPTVLHVVREALTIVAVCDQQIIPAMGVAKANAPSAIMARSYPLIFAMAARHRVLMKPIKLIYAVGQRIACEPQQMPTRSALGDRPEGRGLTAPHMQLGGVDELVDAALAG